MQIIIKHTRRERERSLELTSRHLAGALKGILFTGCVLWLLQQTVETRAVVQDMPQSPVKTIEQIAAEASNIDAPPAFLLASPVPEGLIDPAESGQPNWLVAALQSWMERETPEPSAAAAPETPDDARLAAQEAAMREQIDLLARKVGEMEARLTQIDALGERLADMAGVAPETFDFRHPPGQGGLLVEARPMSLGELSDELDALAHHLGERTDYLSVLDAYLTNNAALQSRTPSAMPISGYSYNSSSYGPRVDPITGRRAFHEGLDFAAPRGTPITAAAGGVVISARYHRGYGNMVEVDHGNKLVTRYAHAAKMFVKPGDLVHRGQKIATVGSTGRSTGAHLHFEVRVAGQAADPRLYLAGKGEGGSGSLARLAVSER